MTKQEFLKKVKVLAYSISGYKHDLEFQQNMRNLDSSNNSPDLEFNRLANQAWDTSLEHKKALVQWAEYCQKKLEGK